MPKVTQAKAGKDYPESGINKGDIYYSWSFFRQKAQKSRTYPKASQLAQTKMSGAHAAMESLEDAVAMASSPEDVVAAMNDATENLRNVMEEYTDSIESMEQTFTGGSPTIDDATEKRDGLDQLSADLESAASEIEGWDAEDYKDGEEDKGKTVKRFDDLGALGQQAMLDAAKEKANEYGIDF